MQTYCRQVIVIFLIGINRVTINTIKKREFRKKNTMSLQALNKIVSQNLHGKFKTRSFEGNE